MFGNSESPRPRELPREGRRQFIRTLQRPRPRNRGQTAERRFGLAKPTRNSFQRPFLARDRARTNLSDRLNAMVSLEGPRRPLPEAKPPFRSRTLKVLRHPRDRQHLFSNYLHSALTSSNYPHWQLVSPDLPRRAPVPGDLFSTRNGPPPPFFRPSPPPERTFVASRHPASAAPAQRARRRPVESPPAAGRRDATQRESAFPHGSGAFVAHLTRAVRPPETARSAPPRAAARPSTCFRSGRVMK